MQLVPDIRVVLWVVQNILFRCISKLWSIILLILQWTEKTKIYFSYPTDIFLRFGIVF